MYRGFGKFLILFLFAGAKNIFAGDDMKKRGKMRKTEKKRGIIKRNRKIEKTFKKPLDKGLFL